MPIIDNISSKNTLFFFEIAKFLPSSVFGTLCILFWLFVSVNKLLVLNDLGHMSIGIKSLPIIASEKFKPLTLVCVSLNYSRRNILLFYPANL